MVQQQSPRPVIHKLVNSDVNCVVRWTAQSMERSASAVCVAPDPDNDLDGYPASVDYNDFNASINPCAQRFVVIRPIVTANCGVCGIFCGGGAGRTYG